MLFQQKRYLSQQEVVPTFYNLFALLFCLLTDSLLGIIIVKIITDYLEVIQAVSASFYVRKVIYVIRWEECIVNTFFV